MPKRLATPSTKDVLKDLYEAVSLVVQQADAFGLTREELGLPDDATRITACSDPCSGSQPHWPRQRGRRLRTGLERRSAYASAELDPLETSI